MRRAGAPASHFSEGSRVDKVLVTRLGIEGGGAELFGRLKDGVRCFWTEDTSMDLDENDGEVWRAWSSEPLACLEYVPPRDWTLSFPIEIHPDLAAWFREA